jgi:hypothetical protein
MRLTRRFKKRTLIIVGVMLILAIGGAATAYAVTQTFPDVPPSYWAFGSIEKLASQGIVKGYTDGNFGPEDFVTRAQISTMFDRQQQYTAEQETAPLANIARGCPACHPVAVGDPAAPPFTPGRPDPSRGNAPTFSLKWEAMGGDSTSVRFALHNTLADTSGVNVCLGCHAAGNAENNGNNAPINLRAIAHPAHLFSGIFISEFRGNCFSCHEVTNTGQYDILTQAVAVNPQGIPTTLPIPGQQAPTKPPAQ